MGLSLYLWIIGERIYGKLRELLRMFDILEVMVFESTVRVSGLMEVV